MRIILKSLQGPTAIFALDNWDGQLYSSVFVLLCYGRFINAFYILLLHIYSQSLSPTVNLVILICMEVRIFI